MSRLQYVENKRETLQRVLPILSALESCPILERLVLFEEKGPYLPWREEKLQDTLFQFVERMKYLVVFCFISGSAFERDSVAELKRKFDGLIIPNRPAFWYHVSHNLPSVNDPTVPRIHYNDIVCPIDYYEVSPNF